MANPPVIICDADATIQILLASFIEPLKSLKTRFDIQPVVVPEVDVELRSHRRHSSVPGQYQKALSKGVLVVLNRNELRTRMGAFDESIRECGVEGIWATAAALGRDYELRLDRGEAFTFAHAVTLRVPALSNDASALRVMREHRLSQPREVFRSFDLYALAVQSGAMSLGNADDARGRLAKCGEGVPAAFRNCKFSDGLSSFQPRIVDATLPIQWQREVPPAFRIYPTAGRVSSARTQTSSPTGHVNEAPAVPLAPLGSIHAAPVLPSSTMAASEQAGRTESEPHGGTDLPG